MFITFWFCLSTTLDTQKNRRVHVKDAADSRKEEKSFKKLRLASSEDDDIPLKSGTDLKKEKKGFADE